MATFSWIRRFARAGLCLLAALLCGSAARGQNLQWFDAYAPEGIVLGPDGAMWFPVGWDDPPRRVGRIDASGFVTEFPLPAGAGYCAGIAAGPDGNLWLAENRFGRIYRMTTSGAVVEYNGLSASAHAITAGPDGALWFTEPAVNKIGRITTSGAITEFPLPTKSPGLSGIAAGPDGNLWFADSLKIGRMTPSGAIREFPLPNGTHAVAIAAGPDGNMWFTEGVAKVGRISPAGEIVEFSVTRPSLGIAAGTDGDLWFTTWGRLGRITPKGEITDYSLPDGVPTGPLGLAVGLDDSVWISSDNGFGGQVLRFSLQSPSPCVADATTLCLNDGRFRVTSSWKTADGSTGSGGASTLTASTGYFWFFDPGNVELVVKILNGCSTNGSYWVFAAGLTNVEVMISVTDTTTGVTRDYPSRQGIPFAPIQDTATFTRCQ